MLAYILALVLPLADIASAVLSTQEKAMPWNRFGRYVHPERKKAQEVYRERADWPSSPLPGLTREQLVQAIREGDLPAGTKAHQLRASGEDS